MMQENMKKVCAFLLIGIALLSMSACSCRATGLEVGQNNEKQDLVPSITQTVPADVASASPGLDEHVQEEIENIPLNSSEPRFDLPTPSVSPELMPSTLTPMLTPTATPTPSATQTTPPTPMTTSTLMPTPSATQTTPPTPMTTSASTPSPSAIPTPTPTPSNPSETVDEQNDPFRHEGELIYFPDD